MSRQLFDSGELPQGNARQLRALARRAERFPIQASLRYRMSADATWSEGTSVNISRSGILFRAAEKLQPKTMIEMQILFADSTKGEAPANIACWGPIVRTEPASHADSRPALAAAILRYRFKPVSLSLVGRG